jgi:hypothetical protein
MPPVAWLGLAALMLLALSVGSYAYHRRIDEVERHESVVCAAVGANSLVAIYPVWFILWKSGWVSEPAHLQVFGIMVASTILAYAWRTLRTRWQIG